MIIVLRDWDFIGVEKRASFSRKIQKPLDELTLEDVKPELREAVEQADFVVVMPMNCGEVCVLREAEDEKPADSFTERILPRRPEQLSLLLTFGRRYFESVGFRRE